MRFLLILLQSSIPFIVFCQIGREFKFEKVNGNVSQSTVIDYDNLKLDKTGKPILPSKAADNETLNFYKHGYLIESQQYDLEKMKKEVSKRILVNRKESAINSVEVYTYSRGKESLLRVHETKLNKGQIVSEEVRDENNKLLGTATYSYGTTDANLEFERIAFSGNRRNAEYYSEKDKFGNLIELESNKKDTVMYLERLIQEGDSINKSLIISKKGWNNSPDSILITRQKWFDNKHNPILLLTKMEAISKPPPGEPTTVNFVSSITYHYGNLPKNDRNNIPSQTEIFGGWVNKQNNIELFFEPQTVNGKPRVFGSSYSSKSNEPSIDELLANGEIWKFMLKQDFKYGTWTLDEEGELRIVLSNESVLLFSTKIEFNALILQPKMKDMKGTLKLVKRG